MNVDYEAMFLEKPQSWYRITKFLYCLSKWQLTAEYTVVPVTITQPHQHISIKLPASHYKVKQWRLKHRRTNSSEMTRWVCFQAISSSYVIHVHQPPLHSLQTKHKVQQEFSLYILTISAERNASLQSTNNRTTMITEDGFSSPARPVTLSRDASIKTIGCIRKMTKNTVC